MNYQLLSRFLPIIIGTMVSCTSPSLKFEEENGLIKLLDDQRHVFSYQIETKSLDGQYPRANYVHPLNDFTGNPLTEDFPEDHLHQRGIYWTWHQLYLDTVSMADPWICEGIEWDVRNVTSQVDGPNATIRAEVTWIAGADKIPVLEEEVQIEYHGSENFYYLDFSITLHSLKKSLAIGGSDDIKGYGGFSARLIMGDNLAFSDASGEVIPDNEPVEAGNWVMMDAVGENQNHVVIMYHPESTANLKGWILRKSGSMQNPVWPGRERVVLDKNEQVEIKSRVVVFRGESTNTNIETIYQSYLTDK